MDHHFEIRIDVESAPGTTVGDMNEYREHLLSKIRAAHDWSRGSLVTLKKLEAFQCTSREKVREEDEKGFV